MRFSLTFIIVVDVGFFSYFIKHNTVVTANVATIEWPTAIAKGCFGGNSSQGNVTMVRIV